MRSRADVETSIPSFYFETRPGLRWWRVAGGHASGGLGRLTEDKTDPRAAKGVGTTDPGRERRPAT